MGFKVQLKLLVTCLGVCYAATTFASHEYKFSPRRQIDAVIATGTVNRIQINGGALIEVVGDESKYALYWSSDHRNIFITPKIVVGETLEMSLIFAGGQAQDLRLTVGDGGAATIFINMNNSALASDNVKWTVTDKTQLAEVASMLRSMIADTKDKYYVLPIKREFKKNYKHSKLKITQSKAYRYKDLNGAVLMIENSGFKPILLSNEDFKDVFKNTLAINVEAETIKPRAKGRVFIITRSQS